MFSAIVIALLSGGLWQVIQGMTLEGEVTVIIALMLELLRGLGILLGRSAHIIEGIKIVVEGLEILIDEEESE